MRWFAFLFAVSCVAADAPPVIRSAGSGDWSAETTWEGGRIPAAGARVLVRPGHTVKYDVRSAEPVRGVCVAGTLRFAADADTLLTVGLLKIEPSDRYSEEGFDCEAHVTKPDATAARPALEIGTPDRPVVAGRTATIRLVYCEGMDKQSCPAVVCCGGRMDIHGAPLSRTWVKLGADAAKGAVGVTLAESVSGWRVGDRVIVTGTVDPDFKRERQTEERIVTALDGNRLTLDSPLGFDHRGSGEYRGEVANLSRNVLIESAEPDGERGHTMYHRHSAGSVSYAEFRHLGKENVLGRYALHYHLAGDTMRGSSVVGASIWNSRNRWLTIHGTNYLVARDNVGYRSVGHGFFFEDGTEVHNVLDRNLAVQSLKGKKLPKQALPFDHNEGSGYWWANSLNTFTRNVSCENGRYGFRFEATPSSAMKSLAMPVQQPDGTRRVSDIRTLPFVRFEANESHSEGLYGINLGEGVDRVGPDTRHPFVVKDAKIWAVHYAFRPQSPSMLVDGLKIWRAAYGVYHPNFDNHVYRNVYIGFTNTEPFNRGHDDISAQYGGLTVDGLTFEGIRSGRDIPLIQISDDNPTGRAETHVRNLKVTAWTGTKDRAVVNRGGGPRPNPKSAKGVPVFVHDHFGAGRTGMVTSTKAPDRGDGPEYRSEPLFTGDESRVAEVSGVAFPKLLDPIDDTAPTTVITAVRRLDGGRWKVTGTTADNGTVKRVLVNGMEATATAPNFAEWEIVVVSGAGVEAHAEDAAGNVETNGHAK